MQSLRTSSVFSHFLMNFPGSTSSVLHCDLTTFLVEHRSPLDEKLRFPKLATSPEVDLLKSSGSSSLQTQPMISYYSDQSIKLFPAQSRLNLLIVYAKYVSLVYMVGKMTLLTMGAGNPGRWYLL